MEVPPYKLVSMEEYNAFNKDFMRAALGMQYKDFDGKRASEKAQYYLLTENVDLIDASLHNNAMPFLCQRISIMSRVWRAFRKEGVDGLRDLRLARYELDRWIKYLEASTIKETVLKTRQGTGYTDNQPTREELSYHYTPGKKE